MVSAHGQYLALMGLCVVVTLPLEFVFAARVYRRPLRLIAVLIPVAVLFSAWDILGIARGHWSYNPAFLSGIHLLAGMPLEELVFFLVVPTCGLLTYAAVGHVLAAVSARLSATGRGDDA